ncbi:YadA-like family protein [Agrobacterium sp. LMR679]|uniref:YadA-like family protein n=1 Tax=Agrobacterium sp. LMR679 TaxID=3014335 RepID=UPI0022AEA457|nr:YadA-like family protein [Agrobacterium sp. LMR679]MCZ4072109.1 YadA-like family protein [Agrobacterium sp. LMR679]
MSIPMLSKRPIRRPGFIQSWIAGAANTRSLRRRLMAILRLAHMTLGLGCKRLGLGALGAGAAVAISVLGVSVPASANTIDTKTTCVQGGATPSVGRLGNGLTSTQATDGSGTYSTVAGCDAKGNNQLGVTGYGTFVDLTGQGATGIGFNADAAKWATALGVETRATGTGSTALGFGSQATATNSVAIGSAAGNGTTALSEANSTRATGAGAIAVGANNVRGAQAAAADSIALGGESTVAAEAQSGIAIGVRSSVEQEFGVAIGDQATAGQQGVAIGYDTEASALSATALGFNAKATADNAAAFGQRANATGEFASAFGSTAEASGYNSVAVGGASSASGSEAVALGGFAEATADRALALGPGAQALHEGGVALGEDSVTREAASVSGITIDGQTYTFAGSTPSSVVSVGTEGSERQIVNVAAGEISETSTDAVNGSQLHATNQAVEHVSEVANQGWNISAGGANETNVGPGGSVDLSNTDGNIVVAKTADSADVTFDLADDLQVGNSIAVGGTVINGDSVNTTNLTVVGDTHLGNSFSVMNNEAHYSGPITEDTHIANKQYVDHSVTELADTPLTFAGNSGSVARKLGETVNIVGGGTTIGAYSGANLRTEVDADGNLQLLMAEAPKFGDVVINADGSGRITGIAAGVADTDAVNVSQLTDLADEVEAGKTHYYSVNDGGMTGGNYNNDGATGNNSLAAGIEAEASGDFSTSVGYRNVASGEWSNAIGSDNEAVGDQSSAIGRNNEARGTASSALGYGNEASGNASSAIGNNNRTSADGASAVGVNNRVSGAAASAVGAQNTADGTFSSAIGVLNTASGDRSFAAGTESVASGESSVAVGNGAQAAGASSLAIGDGAFADGFTGTLNGYNAGALALGTEANATGTQSIAVGTGSSSAGQTAVAIGFTSQASGLNAIAAGNGSVASGRAGVAIGWGAHAENISTVAHGSNARATGRFATAVGAGSNAAADNSLALGSLAEVTAENSVALGAGSVADGSTLANTAFTPTGDLTGIAGIAPVGEVSVGSAGSERRITNVAAGSADTDAVNVSQLNALGEHVDATATHYYSVNDGGAAGGNYNNDGATGSNALAAGVRASAAGTNATAVGTDSTASAVGSTAVGYRAAASGSSSLAVGDGAAASGDMSTAVGNNNSASGTYSSAIGGGNIASNEGASAVGQGNSASGNLSSAMGSANFANGDWSNAFGFSNTASGTNSSAVGVLNTASGDRSFAAGTESVAVGTSDVAIGDRNMVDGQTSEAATGVGFRNTVTGRGSVAIGSLNTVAIESGTAVGQGNNVSGGASAAFGAYNVASGTSSLAMGLYSRAEDTYATAIGAQSIAEGFYSTAIGGANIAREDETTSVGFANDAGGIRSTAVGRMNSAYGEDSNAFGSGNTVMANEATAVGTGNNIQAGADRATVLGAHAEASVADGVALGSHSVANTAAGISGYVPIGADPAAINATTSTLGALSIGDAANGQYRQITGVAAGTQDSDAVNVAQLKALGEHVDASATHYYSVNDGGTVGGNYNNDGATGENSLAAGVLASASGEGATALGFNTTASGDHSLAMGENSSASGTSAVAIGTTATASGDLATAIGNNANASGGGAIALGWTDGSGTMGALGDESVAIGNGATSAGVRSLALGWGAKATEEGSVAIGAGSVTRAATSVAGVTINGQTYAFAGGNPASVLSVGTEGSERQIVNVAAGELSATSTDAVNGSQLHATNQAVEHVSEVANQGWNISAQGANQTNVGPGGSVDLSNTDGNIVVAKAADSNDVTFDLADDIEVGNSITVGGTVINGDSVTTTNLTAGDNFYVDNSGAHYDGPITDETHIVNKSYVDNSVTELADTPLTFAGNSGSVDRKLGETMTIAGGGTTIGAYSGANLRTEVDADGNLQLLMTEAPKFGDVVINADGSGRITGVTAGVDGTDAVNVDQLNEVAETANAGWNISTQGANQTNVGPGGSVDLNNTDGNIVVAKAADSNDVTFDLADDLEIGNSITVGGTVINGDSVTTTNLTAGDNFYVDNSGAHYDGPITENTHIANKEYVDNSVTELADTPLTFAGNSGSVARKLGETMNIVGGGTTIGAYSGGNLRTEVDADGNLQLLMAEAPKFGDVVINADGSGRITGVTAGVDGTDAVNVDQLNEVAETANAGWNISASGENVSKVAPGDTVDLSNTDGNIKVAKTADSNDVTFDLADDLVIGNSITVGDTYIDGTGLTIAGGPSITTTGIDAGSLRITNVAPGMIGASSLDAINGSQLWGMGNSIANHLGGSDYGVSVLPDGTLSAPSYQIAAIDPNGNVTNVTHDNVGDALGGLSQSVTNVSSRIDNIDNGGGIKYFHTNSSAPDSQAVGQESVAIGPEAIANGDGSIAMGNGATTATGADGAIAIGKGAKANNANDVALGSGSVTQEAVATTGTTINGTDYKFAGTAPVGTVSVGDKDAERTITNVAAGRISETSTDAVNGSQLHATNQAIDNLSGEIGEVADGAVMYDKNPDGSRANSVTLVGGDPNAPVLISNVAAGVKDTDAANVGQLKEGLSTTLNESKSYTDNRVNYAIETSNAYTDKVAVTTLNQANNYTDYKFGQLNQEIGEVRSEARQAAAIGLAAASLRYDDRPGKASVAVGGGFWRGEGALAFGAGYTSEDGRLRTNLSATTAGGKWGVGAGLSFTLN